MLRLMGEYTRFAPLVMQFRTSSRAPRIEVLRGGAIPLLYAF